MSQQNNFNKCYNKWFLSKVKQAIGDYKMIQENDRLAVGISGKDSIALLYILQLIRQRSKLKFELQAIHVDLGLNADIFEVKEYCRSCGIPFHTETTQISEIIFKAREESNPCSLCSKMRKGALNNAALALGCNKVALGHHLDDAVETLLMNIIYTGKLGTFTPKVYLDRKQLTLIRPLIYIPEETLTSLVRLEQLPVIINPCRIDGHTKRQEMKLLFSELKLKYPDLQSKFLSALQNVQIDDLWQLRLEREDFWCGKKTEKGN